jgi:Ca2+-binding EF-hand superfamily protein
MIPTVYPIAGQEHDAVNMFKMMDKDKNKSMDFAEFVLILVLPKSPEEITAEQFANRNSL